VTRRFTTYIATACMLVVSAARSSAETVAAGSRSAPSVIAAAGGAVGPQQARTVRRARIRSLGEYSVTILWDNRVQIELASPDFAFRKVISENGDSEVVVGGRGEDDISIRTSAEGLTVARGGRQVAIAHDGAAALAGNLDDVRAVLGGRAMAAFRERMGAYERRFLTEAASGEQPFYRRERMDEPFGCSMLFSAALVAELTGDPSALARARQLITSRIQSRLRVLRVGLEIDDCVTDYEKYLLEVDRQLTQCEDAADGREYWYERAADRLGCHLEFVARAESGLLQFLSCSTLQVV
jgi:hypothetical protein